MAWWHFCYFLLSTKTEQKQLFTFYIDINIDLPWSTSDGSRFNQIPVTYKHLMSVHGQLWRKLPLKAFKEEMPANLVSINCGIFLAHKIIFPQIVSESSQQFLVVMHPLEFNSIFINFRSVYITEIWKQNGYLVSFSIFLPSYSKYSRFMLTIFP